MPKIIVPLTETQCRNTKNNELPYRLYDGGGLYLDVISPTRKYWRLKFRHLGRESRMALGTYPEISLAEARDLRSTQKKHLTDNINPVHLRKNKRESLKNEIENTFEKLARDWHEKNQKIWTARHAKYVITRLEKDVFSHIGSRPLARIEASEIVAIMLRVEAAGKRDLPRRLKYTMDQIFRYGVITDRVKHNPIMGMKSGDILKPRIRTHFAALDYRELPGFLEKLEKNEARLFPLTRLALKMMLLTFVRTKELINAEWGEFDLENREWRIPAHRMKMRREHIVPLSGEVMEILACLKKYRIQRSHSDLPDYVFPNQVNGRKPMSDNTLLKSLERMGYKGQATGHGFRATAMSTIKERLNYRHEVIDRQLAHAHKDKTDAAYDRALFLDERRVMMQHWAEYISTLNVTNIVSDGRLQINA